MTVTTSTCLASSPMGWAVTSAVRAPALRATPASVRAVARSPGPAETMKRSPTATSGVVMSPQTATLRPMWKSRMAKPRICRPSRPSPNTTMRLALTISSINPSSASSGIAASTAERSASACLARWLRHSVIRVSPLPAFVPASPASASWLARPERLELPTLGFEDRYSIQLSYGRASRARHNTKRERLGSAGFSARRDEEEPRERQEHGSVRLDWVGVRDRGLVAGEVILAFGRVERIEERPQARSFHPFDNCARPARQEMEIGGAPDVDTGAMRAQELEIPFGAVAGLARSRRMRELRRPRPMRRDLPHQTVRRLVEIVGDLDRERSARVELRDQRRQER